MVVGGAGIGTVDIGIPAVAVHDAVAGFVAGAGSGTLMHGDGGGVDVFFLDMVEVAHGSVLGGVGRGRSRGGDSEGGLAPLASGLAGLVGGGHGGMEGGQLAHHPLVLVLLICMDGLGMLAQIVEAGKLL